MTVHLMHIYDRQGNSVYEKEWSRKKRSNMTAEEEKKLLFGMIHSIKSFVAKISPKDSKEGFLSYTTSTYKLHFYESPTGLKLILVTDIFVGNIRETLKKIYSSIYVEFVVRNSLCPLDEPIRSSLFESKLENFMSGLTFFEDSS